MAQHKRITRKNLRQPDAFLVLTGKLNALFQAHKKNIYLYSALLLAVFVALWAWNQYWKQQTRSASIAYSAALDLYHLHRYDDALAALDNVLIYGSTSYHPLAYFYKGNTYLALGRYDEATQAMTVALADIPKTSPLYELAIWTMGSIQDQAGKCQEALKSYRQVIEMNGVLKDEAMLATAKCSDAMDQREDAITAYKEFLEAFPSAQESTQIRLRLAELAAQGS